MISSAVVVVVLCCAGGLAWHALNPPGPVAGGPGHPVRIVPESVLRDGRLGPLPPSAVVTRSEGWAGFFTGEISLDFSAPTAEVCRFLVASGSVRSAHPEITDDYCEPDASGRSPWDVATRDVESLLFSIPPRQDGHNSGSVLIDAWGEDVHIVVTWS